MEAHYIYVGYLRTVCAALVSVCGVVLPAHKAEIVVTVRTGGGDLWARTACLTGDLYSPSKSIKKKK